MLSVKNVCTRFPHWLQLSRPRAAWEDWVGGLKREQGCSLLNVYWLVHFSAFQPHFQVTDGDEWPELTLDWSWSPSPSTHTHTHTHTHTRTHARTHTRTHARTHTHTHTHSISSECGYMSHECCPTHHEKLQVWTAPAPEWKAFFVGGITCLWTEAIWNRSHQCD